MDAGKEFEGFTSPQGGANHFGAELADQQLTGKGVPSLVQSLCEHILSERVVQHNGLFAEQANSTELEVFPLFTSLPLPLSPSLPLSLSPPTFPFYTSIHCTHKTPADDRLFAAGLIPHTGCQAVDNRARRWGS
jgi:hypothetical protein